MTNKRYMERHKKLGLCTSCNEKAAKNRLSCKKHLRLDSKKSSEYQKKQRRFYKKVKK